MACPRNFAVDPAAPPEDGLRRAVAEGTGPSAVKAYRSSMALAAARADGMAEFRGWQA